MSTSSSGGCGATDPNGYSELVQSDCPVAYWRLGESCSGMSCFATNQANTAQQGVYRGGFTLGEEGALPNDSDTSVLLNTDQDGHIDVQPTLSFGNLAPFSLEVWFKPSERSVELFPDCYNVGLLAHDGPPDGCSGVNNPFPGYRLVMNSGCRFEFEMLECNGPKIEVRSEPYQESRWYHLVATFDGFVQRLYVDGVLVRDIVSGTAELHHEPSFPFTIGGRGDGGWNQIDGWLDEPAVYDYALTGQQVFAHFTASGR